MTHTPVYDFIIIGTGASGSVLAHFLQQAGASVCLLEAGRNFKPAQFPANELHANASLMWHGGMECSTDANTVFLRGKVVGGGTIVNSALLDRFDDIALDDFRSQSGIDFYNREEMDKHYQAIEEHLSLAYIPESDWNQNARLYQKGFDTLGLKVAPLRRGQAHCDNKNNDCLVCVGGCRRQSKQSMAVTFLPKAMALGAELITGFHVQQIIHGRTQVAIYGVQNNRQQVLYSRKCILAAGSLGTTELLQKSGFQDQLPALGHNFHCHPQIMSFALMDHIVDAHKGAFQALKSDDPRFRKQGFKLENVFTPPAGAAMLKAGFGPEHQQLMAQYRNLAGIEVCVRDEVPGQLRLNNHGRLLLDKPFADIDRQKAQAGLEQVHGIFAAVGARRVMDAPFLLALHLMGGCTIGQNPNHSVVNERFQVHGLPNLAIADGSIYPLAPGINPSLTIMAQSHKASQLLIEDFDAGLTANPNSGKEQCPVDKIHTERKRA